MWQVSVFKSRAASATPTVHLGASLASLSPKTSQSQILILVAIFRHLGNYNGPAAEGALAGKEGAAAGRGPASDAQ